MAVAAWSGNALAFESPRELADACQVVAKAARGTGWHIRIPASRDALMCWGYMQAVQDFLVLADASGRRILGSCPPDDVTTLQLVRTFLEYARTHPHALTGNMAGSVILGLQEAFPCNDTDAAERGE